MSGLSIEVRIVISSLFCGMIFRKGLKRTAFMSFLGIMRVLRTSLTGFCSCLLAVIKETGKQEKSTLRVIDGSKQPAESTDVTR